MKRKVPLKFLPFYLFAQLPFWAVYLLSDFLFFILYYIIGYRKEVVFDNMRRAFPDKTEDEIQTTARRFYAYFVDMFLEIPMGLGMSEKQIRERYKITNIEVLDQLHAQGKSIVYYVGHLGNWEWMSMLPVVTKYNLVSLYQKQKNKYFDELMLFLRSYFSLTCVESKQGYKSVIEFSRKNIPSMFCFPGDQSPSKGGKSSKHWTQFMGRDTAFLEGAARIANKTGLTVVFPSFARPKRGYYEITVHVLEENAKETTSGAIIDKYAEHLQEAIKQQPELWLWTHKRWKLQKPELVN